MASKRQFEKPVGVVGAGNFGTCIANILSENSPVLMLVRDMETLRSINETRLHRGQVMSANITATLDFKEVAGACEVIFPIVPSSHFRATMKNLSSFLKPYHILIHGTKGFDVNLPAGRLIETEKTLSRDYVRTMSEVIKEETAVVRVGCLAGPNLSGELSQRQPGATVVASPFNEVIQIGKKLLKNDRFNVYENPDLIGVELAGVIKNIIAIASGALSGLGFGENAKGLLVSRGAVEMVYLGRALGGNTKAFLGVAGIGDLVTTCNSPMSRNFTVGYRLAKGEKLNDILLDMEEVAEGVNTVMIAKKCADFYQVRALITQTLYRVLFQDLTMQEALNYLMRYPLNVDIDFIA